jgi:hypothetical protein
MRNVALFLVICVIIILGCTSNHQIYFSRYTEEIKSIQYNDILLDKQDYQAINDILSEIEFNDKKLNNLGSTISTLTITTIENDKYYFYIYPKNVIKYVNSNKTYYATNNTNLLNLCNEVKNKYTNTIKTTLIN